MAIPRRLDPLPHLQGLMLPQVDHDSTVQDVKEIVALPYLGVAGVAELGSNSLVHDGLAGIVVTCCPYLKEVAFGLFTSATPSSFPYELMSAIQEQEVEKPVWSSSFRPIQGPEALGMFLRHSGTLREIALGMYCFVGNDVLSSILETCEALEHLSVQRGHDGSTLARTPISSVDLDGSELWLWVCKRSRHLEIAFATPMLPRTPDQWPYYDRTSAATMTGILPNQEHQHFRILESVSPDRLTDATHRSHVEGV